MRAFWVILKRWFARGGGVWQHLVPRLRMAKMQRRQRIRTYFQNRPGSSAAAKRSAQEGIPVLSNRICAHGLDHALRIGCEFGLKRFENCVDWPLDPEKKTLYFVDSRQLPEQLCQEGEVKRACVLDLASGQTALALPRNARPELHCISDCGSVGFQMGMWMFTKGSLRGSWSSDVLAHDLHGSVKNAIVSAGLWLVVLEVALVLNFTSGPFASDSNWEEVAAAALDCWAFVEEDDELFETFYPALAREHGLWATETAFLQGASSL